MSPHPPSPPPAPDEPTLTFWGAASSVSGSMHLLEADNIADDTNYVGYELPAWKAIDIDTPAELEHARALYAVYADRLAAEDR